MADAKRVVFSHAHETKKQSACSVDRGTRYTCGGQDESTSMITSTNSGS